MNKQKERTDDTEFEMFKSAMESTTNLNRQEDLRDAKNGRKKIVKIIQPELPQVDPRNC